MKYFFVLIMIIAFVGCNNNSGKNANKPFVENTYIDGEKLFKIHCAMCHISDVDMVGPALRNTIEHLGNTKRAVSFVQNSEMFLKDAYILSLKKKYNSKYTHNFKSLTKEDIMAIIYWCEPCRLGATKK